MKSIHSKFRTCWTMPRSSP